MGAQYRLVLIVFGCFFLVLSVVGCGGDGGCCCDLPHGAKDWFIDFDLGYIPDVIAAYPILVNITVRVSSFENGGPAPDGLVVALAVAPGSFDNGLVEIERPVVDGRVATVVLADVPGVYTLTVRIPGESASATTTFSVGL